MELIVFEALGKYWVTLNGQSVPKDERVPLGVKVVFMISGSDPNLLFREAKEKAGQRGIQVQNLD